LIVPVAFGGNNQAGPIDVATARNACASASGRLDFETETFLVQQPVAFQQTADCLTAAYGTKWNGNASATNGSLFAAQPVAIHEAPYVASVCPTHTLDCTAGPAVQTAMQVRRLTPVECCRLQGFPDDYLTQVPWRGKSTPPDGPMYKALGNSWAVPVVAWIGRRIKEHIGD
jgi:DNA (cytosine-5)-methyltransferase 1